mgnify:CR=1 FL=1
MTIDAVALSELYKDNLLKDVIPFWEKNSIDKDFGGFFTCLDKCGHIYDTDKFIWLQARQVWTFSMMYQEVEPKQEWLDIALHGAEFLKKFGRDEDGDWYFSLKQDGEPLIQPYNIFSDCFACMAFGKLYQITKDDEHAAIARFTFDRILQKQHQAKGKYEKSFPGTRSLQSFSLPMILCNLVLEIEPILNPELVSSTIQHGIQKVMEEFYQEDFGLILEHVGLEGEFVDSFEGRLINPGHGLEAMWFIMDLAKREQREDIVQKAVEISLQILERSWDKEHQGIFYFMDVLGKPVLQLEWDQKLWWVHIETMITLAKGYLLTGNEQCASWFNKVHEYTWTHFPDLENGEWFGYLNRSGQPLLDLKGGKWKGCFHVPRGLFQLWSIMEKLKIKQQISLLNS